MCYSYLFTLLPLRHLLASILIIDYGCRLFPAASPMPGMLKEFSTFIGYNEIIFKGTQLVNTAFLYLFCLCLIFYEVLFHSVLLFFVVYIIQNIFCFIFVALLQFFLRILECTIMQYFVFENVFLYMHITKIHKLIP